MKAKDLLNALALPLNVATSAARVNAMFQNIRLADGKAFATDGATSVEMAGDLPDVQCCVLAARLQSALTAIASVAGDAEVKLKVDGKRLVVSGPRVRQSMATLPAADMPMPVWPDGETPIKDWPALVSALKFVERAAARKDTYAALVGVATVAGALAATDRHRAHVAYGESQLADGIVIPISAVDVLCSLPEGRAFAVSENALAVHFKGGRFLAQLVPSKFPGLQFVPDKHADNVARVGREVLERAVGAMRKVRLTPAAKVAFELDKIVLQDDSHDGDARIELNVAYKGEPWAFGVNAQYLLEACQALDGDEVAVSWGGELKHPMRLSGKSESRCAVIMQWQK